MGLLLERIRGERKSSKEIVLPTRLVVCRTCGGQRQENS